MTRTKLYLLLAGTILLAFAICGSCALLADTPPPADICSGSYFYKDACGDWRVGWPGDGDATTQGNCAHGFMAKDNTDGVWYYIVGAGPGGQRYPRPRVSAPFANTWWVKCFVDHDPTMIRTYPSCSLPGVGGTWSPILLPLSSPLIPPAKKASWIAQFHCGSTTPTTPVFTNTRTTTVQRTATRTKTQTPGGCVGPGGVPCQTPTRSPSRTPTVVPRTATRTSTSVPHTPVPGRTVVPPNTTAPPVKTVNPRPSPIPPTALATPATQFPSPTSTPTGKGKGCLGIAFLTVGVIYVSVSRLIIR